MVSVARIKVGRLSTTTCLIVDAQSVKNTDTAKNKGYDAGKKVSGIKRHIAVDTQGFPHAIVITTANISDRDGAILLFKAEAKKSWKKVKKILCDGGYRGEKFAKTILKKTDAEVEIVKRNDVPRFEVLPKRWIVERSFSWLEKCRRLYKNSEAKLASSLAMVQLAFLILILKRS
jgi:transposase